MSYNQPYVFKASGKQVVINHSHGATLRVSPNALGQADGHGGQGAFAHWKVHLIGNNHCRLQSVKTGKYLRIWRGGNHIDVQGGTGQFTKFKIHRIAMNGVKLESDVFRGKYIAVKPGKNVAIGSGGGHCALYPKRQGGGGGGKGGGGVFGAMAVGAALGAAALGTAAVIAAAQPKPKPVVVVKPQAVPAQGIFALPYGFHVNNKVVIKGNNGRHLRVSPNNNGLADGSGGTGKFARWNIIKDGQRFVKLQSIHTGKYLRIQQNGAVNVGGGGGQWTRFRVHITRQPNFAKLESAKLPGKYIAIGPNGGVRQGSGGVHCQLSFWREGATRPQVVMQPQPVAARPQVVVVNPAQNAMAAQQQAMQAQMAAQQAQMQQQMAQMKMQNEAQMAQQRAQIEQERQQMEAQQQAAAAQLVAQQQAVLDQQAQLLAQQALQEQQLQMQQNVSASASPISQPPLQTEGVSGSSPVNPYYGNAQSNPAPVQPVQPVQPVYPVLQPQANSDQKAQVAPEVDMGVEEKAPDVSAMGAASEVLKWLTAIDMQAYFSTFQANGFDSLATIAEMTQDDLEQMKSPMEVKIGHRKLLLAAAVTAQFAGRMVKLQSVKFGTFLHEYGKADREKEKVKCTLQHNDKKDKNGTWWLFETLADNRCRLQQIETGAYLRLAKDDEEATAVAPYGTRQELVLEKDPGQKGVYYIKEQLGDLYLRFNEPSTFGYNKVEASEKKSKNCAVRLQVMQSKVTRAPQGLPFNASVKSVVALQSVAFGTYVCAEKNDALVCDRARIGKRERFRVMPMGDGKVGLCAEGANFKKYVSVNRKGKATADKPHLKGHEVFETVMAEDGSFALRSFRGTYLMALPDGRMTATKFDTGSASPWERFMVSVIQQG